MAKIPKGGMYGAAVFTVVLVAAMFIVILSDVQEETREVVKYDYTTDITGLFGYDETPQYYEYDLSQSYTGYYTDDSSPYFGGVTAVTTAGQTIYDDMTDDVDSSGTVNQYRLKLPEVVAYSSDSITYGSSNFDSTDWSDPPGYTSSDTNCGFIFADYGSSGTSGTLPYSLQNYFPSGHVENLGANYMGYSDIQTLWSAHVYEAGGEGVIYRLYEQLVPGGTMQSNYVMIQGTEDSDVNNRWFIGSVEDYVQVNSAVYALAYCEKDYYDSVTVKPVVRVDGKDYAVQIAAHSFIADMRAGTVALYAEYVITEDSVPIRTIALDKAMMIYDWSYTPEITDYSIGYLIPAGAAYYDEVYAYLNPNVGVRVTSL